MGIDPKSFAIVVDDTSVSGEWVRSSLPVCGLSDGNTGKGMRSAKFPFQVDNKGLHEVRVSFFLMAYRAGITRLPPPRQGCIPLIKGKETVKLCIHLPFL